MVPTATEAAGKSLWGSSRNNAIKIVQWSEGMLKTTLMDESIEFVKSLSRIQYLLAQKRLKE